LAIYELEGDRYTKVAKSSLLPQLPTNTFLRCITHNDQYDSVTEFLSEF